MGFGNLFNLDKIIDAKVDAKLEIKLADTIKNQVAEQIAVNTDNRTQIVQYGMTQTEAKEYLYLLCKQNLLPVLREEARKEAEQRVLDFQKEFLLKADKELSEADFNKFADPDVQFITNKAVETVARYNREDLNNILSDLIIDRLKTDDDLEKIVINDAIQILPKFTLEQLKLMTIKFLFSYNLIAFYDAGAWEELNDHLNKTLSYFLDIDINKVGFNTLHIASTGAASLPGITYDFRAAFCFEYAYLFFYPHTKDYLEAQKLTPEVIEIVFDKIDDNNFQVKPIYKNGYIAKQILKDKLTKDELNQVTNIISGFCSYNTKADETIIEKIDLGDKLTKMWKTGHYGAMRLTSVGKAIASILYEQVTGIKVDWKDYEV